MSAVVHSTNLNRSGTSAFDQHHPPSAEIIDKCVHCGFCLPTCPTYSLWGEEMDSPRGRIYLMKLAAEGAAAMNSEWVGHFDKCLGCMACMTACPSGVDYGNLIEATRAQIERNYHRPLHEQVFRRFLFRVFTNPQALHVMRTPLGLYQRSGMQRIVRKSGLLRLLPMRLRAMESLLPSCTRRELISELTPAQGNRRARVGLLLGCVQHEFFSHVNAATVRVLAAEGCEVVVPSEQSCCGALMIHAGEEKPALELARRTIEAFEQAGVDVAISNAAGCGSNLKDYGHLLRDDPKYAERARRFSAKCRDIVEFLSELGPQAVRRPLPMRIAFHDSCHLQHAQGVRSQPRQVLKQIPELKIVELPEAAICCGSAGIYNLVQPAPAQALGDRKAALIVPLHVDAVATGNPGCLMQIQSALTRKGQGIPVLHTIELLDRSINAKQPVA
ncbi:MAG TPA: glycolate oxidase subunit GlcF [Terriglobales bacterium]|nr:glycolate oxidase subunit GlcF [Terriglobales bacterium]